MRSRHIGALIGTAGITLVSGRQSSPTTTLSSSVVNTADTTITLPISTTSIILPVSTTSITLSNSTTSVLLPTTIPVTHSTSTLIPLPPTSSLICVGETLNVIGASLDWWYPSIVYDAVSTLSYITGAGSSTIGWTIVPASTSFDLTSALETPSCSASCATSAAPTAAATTVISQIAYIPAPTNAGTGTPPNVVATPTAAAISVPGGGEFIEGTAFVYFSSYELITKLPTTDAQGSLICGTKTSEYPLVSPFSFAYTGPNPNGASYASAGVTGPVDSALLGVVKATAATPGYWLAAPTVAIVVQQVFAVAEGPALTQSSATQLQTITPTLPPFLTPLGPVPTGPPFTGFPPGQQSTALSLQIPTPTPIQSPPTVTGSGQTIAPQTTFITSEATSNPTTAVQAQSSTLPGGMGGPYNSGSTISIHNTIIWLAVTTWVALQL